MTWAKRIVALLGGAMLLAGCGGGGGGAKKASGPPTPREPLTAAVARLERVLPKIDCRTLAPLMLHSVAWDKAPSAPPSAEQCRAITSDAHDYMRGFHTGVVQQFGPAGIAQGGGAATRPGELVGTIWILDRDHSWKVVYDAFFRPQIGIRHAYGRASDANAQRFVTAMAAGNCDGFWRLLNASSRFAGGGGKRKFCGGFAQRYADRKSAFAQLKADPRARPHPLGRTRDIAFYGLELKNGRYLVMVLAGRLGGVTAAEQREHDNPGVLELVTVRRGRE